MNSRLADYVVALSETGSFRRAAERCYITTPTLSIQIRTLEEFLGVTLFDRAVQPVRLTAQGRALLPRFLHISRSVRELRDAAGELARLDPAVEDAAHRSRPADPDPRQLRR
jgi:DNA-binding transcriptional LysR family regulator